MQFKAMLKHMLRYTPFRVIRRGVGNRFQALDDLLVNLKHRRFAPTHIIDGGANVGEFAKLARRTWSNSLIHLIEPQESCRPALEILCRTPGFHMHMVALGEKTGVISLAADPGTTSTGAHIIEDLAIATGPILEVPVIALDDLFRSESITSGPIMLKLDLQGYELHALQGAIASLPLIDAILVEVSFYAQAYEPSVASLVKFLDDKGFELHDIGAVSGRSRDGRAHQADFLFVQRHTLLALDTSWD